MNRTIRTVAAIAVVSLVFQVRLIAAPKGVKPAKVTAAKPMTAPAGSKPPKGAHSPAKSTGGHAVKPVKSARTGGSATKPAKSTAKADARAAKHSSTTTAGTTSGSSSGTASTTTDAGNTTAPIVVSNPIADKISRNPKLAAKIASRLPSDVTLAQASTGFKNQGQFLAAVNVSRNLGIDFVKLQTAMTGQKVTVDSTTHAITTTPTGDVPLSLGRAIQTLKPGVDADAAVQTAQTQTSQMVR